MGATGMKELHADYPSVERTVKTLIAEGQVVELRTFGRCSVDPANPDTFPEVGWFDDHDQLIREIVRTSFVRSVTMSVNELTPSFLEGKPRNQLVKSFKGNNATDADFIRVRWICIDDDGPKRPEGVSATHDEKCKAFDSTMRIYRRLCEEYKFSPRGVYIADSGNAYNILLAVDLAVNSETSFLLKRFMRAIQKMEPETRIDQLTARSGRAIKPFGIVARKGPNTDERPHRLSHLKVFNEYPIEPISAQLLESVAGIVDAPRLTTNFTRTGFWTRELVEELWKAVHWKHSEPSEYNGGLKWTFTCLANSEHTYQPALILTNGHLGIAGCMHATCPGRTHTLEDFRKRFANQLRNFSWPNEAKGEAGGILELDCAADMEPQLIEWMWPGKIPLGKATLFSGDMDLGKSLVSVDVVARLTSGREWPDGKPNPLPPSGAIIVTSEDDPHDTVIPRLIAAGADLSRVFFIKSTPNLSSGLAQIRMLFEEHPDIRLIVWDPLAGFLGDTDINREQGVRNVLDPYVRMLADLRIASIAIGHFNKTIGLGTKQKTIGATAFTAIHRFAWSFHEDEENKEHRIIAPVKGNIAKRKVGIKFTIEGHTTTLTIKGQEIESEQPLVRWLGDSHKKADDLLARAEDRSAEAGEVKRCVTWLKEFLASGRKQVGECIRAAENEGYSNSTARRASRELDVARPHEGKTYFWELQPAEKGLF